MTKTYAILQKKLQDLELQLSPYNNNHNLTLLPPHLSQEISQKLLFLANLLSAETASCPTTTQPRHLKHIAHRLAHLEATFFRDSGTDRDLLLIDHADGSSSTCSCTESCLNDDEVASTHASSCLDDEKEDEEGGEFYECVEEEKEKEERKIEGVGRLYCGAMASGFVIGVSLMGVAVFFIETFGYLLQVDQQNNGGFVTPT